MKKIVRHLAAAVVIASASMGFVTVAMPAVSSAQCTDGWWWDPVGNVCRPPVVPPPLGCTDGWWWDPVANVCRPPVVPPPMGCTDGSWWDPVANVCRPPLVPPPPR